MKRVIAFIMVVVLTIGGAGGVWADQIKEHMDIEPEKVAVEKRGESLGVTFSGGNGSAEDPYQIATSAQLDAIRNDLRAHYILISDIDLQGVCWIPIGSGDNPFLGTIDGNNHIIKNLSFGRDSMKDLSIVDNTDDRYYCIGLFGLIGGNSRIKNIVISNVMTNLECDLSGISYGTVCGAASLKSESILIENCYAEGYIFVGNQTDRYLSIVLGGIVGKAHRDSIIKDCSNRCTIRVENNNGVVVCSGICGNAVYANIEGCANYADLSIDCRSDTGWNRSYVGGVTGYGGNISKSLNYGNISATTCGPGAKVGGISGGYYWSDDLSVQKSINYADHIISLVSDGTEGPAARICNTTTDNVTDNYSISTCTLNGVIPTDDLGHDKQNGESFNSGEAPWNWGYCGDDLSWEYNKDTKTLTISGMGMMEGYDTDTTAEEKWGTIDIETVIIEDGVTSIGENAFCGCIHLSKAFLPNSLMYIGAGSFGACEALKAINIPEKVELIGFLAFEGCNSLKRITIPNSVTWVGPAAFSGCTNLSNVVLSNTLASIEWETFEYCSNLTEVTIPSSITGVGENAFNACNRLNDVYYTGSSTDWGSMAISSGNDCLKKATVHYEKVDSLGTEDAPSVFFTLETDPSIKYDESYNASQFNLNIGALCMPTIDNKTPIYNNVILSVELPDGLSFSANSVQKSYQKNLGTMSMTDGYTKRQDVSLPVYITTSDYQDIFPINVSASADGYSKSYTKIYDIPVLIPTPEPQRKTLKISGESRTINWDWNLFNKNSDSYYIDLSYAGLYLSDIAYNKDALGIPEAFNVLGFDNVVTCNYSTSRNGNNPAICIGSKTGVIFNGEKKAIVAIAIRGTQTDGDKYVTDLDAAFDGFSIPADNSYEIIKTYLEPLLNRYSKKNIILFVTGHSLGGAICGKLAQRLLQDGYDQNKTFVYTYASPLYTMDYGDPSDYTNVWNVIHAPDLVPVLPWEKTREGHDRFYSLEFSPKEKEELKRIQANPFKLMDEVDFYHLTDKYLRCVDKGNDYSSFNPEGWNRVKVECPVDISVYRNGKLLAETKGESVQYQPACSNIVVMTEGDKKYIYSSDNTDYELHLKGTSNGAMKFSVQTSNAAGKTITSEKVFDNVVLETGKTFTSYIDITDDEVVDVENTQLYLTDTSGNPILQITESGEEVEITEPIGNTVEIPSSQLCAFLYTGQTAHLNREEKNLRWISDDPSIATVDNGYVKAVSLGNTIVSAINPNGGRCEYDIYVAERSPGEVAYGYDKTNGSMYYGISGVKGHYVMTVDGTGIPDYPNEFDVPSGYVSVPKQQRLIQGFTVGSQRYWAKYMQDIEKVVIKPGITSIGYCAFQLCTSMKEISMPDTVTSIDSLAFDNCSALTSIRLPKNCAKIDSGAFYYCKNLNTVSIPLAVTEIGFRAFDECQSLKEINYEGTEEQWKRISVEAGNDILKEVKINYNEYESHEETFANLVVKQKTDMKDYFGEVYKKYSVSPKTNATINNKGILTAKKPGKIVVMAYEKRGKLWEEVNHVELTICQPTFKEKTVEATYDGQSVDVAELLDENGCMPDSWESSNTKVATVDVYGVATVKNKGTAKIMAVFGDGKNAAKYPITLKVAYPKMSKAKSTMQTGAVLKLKLNNTKKQADWAVDNDVLAEVDQTGKVTALTAGYAIITATVDNQEYYCEVTITEPQIKKEKLTIKVGKTGKVGLKNTKLKTIEWKSDDESIATVDNKGNVKGIKPGTVDIYTEAGGIYNACTVTVK